MQNLVVPINCWGVSDAGAGWRMFRTFGGGLRLGVALVDVRLDVVRLPPRSSSPTVAGCRLGGDPVGHDRWGGERVVGGVLSALAMGSV